MKKEMVKELSQEKLDFLAVEEKEREIQREKTMKEKGLLDYLNMENGVNEFTLLPEIPTKRMSSYNKLQYVFKVKKDGQERIWTVTINSPFSAFVLDKWAKAPIDVSVMKSGKGTETRYEFIGDND